MPTTHLLYLHGFRSSPQSAKARLMAQRVAADFPAVQWWCPQLPPSPAEAAALIERGIAQWPREGMGEMAVCGSSLGGYYATWVAERMGCRAVVINPAVDPARDLAAHIGEQTAWHKPEERFFFQPAYIDELRALHAGPLTRPERYMALIAQGDELLDWREMAARYAGTRLHVLPGGDHALSDFAQHVDAVLDFLELARA
ncbi:MAG: YqiA/YcfP family alpha/beta fold hydrolase [Pseudomonadota bacterium]|nr:YqiA/YcfP family alpha/beta fold hydrolase [Pseudomonadota bacterium]